MLTYLPTPVRAALLAAVLAFAAQTAEARGADQPQTTAITRSTARTKPDTEPGDRDGIPIGGILIVVGIVGVVIILAWAASRVGDSRPTM